MDNTEIIEFKKKDRVSGTCGTMTKDLTFMSSGYQKERSKRVQLKKYSKTFPQRCKMSSIEERLSFQ